MPTDDAGADQFCIDTFKRMVCLSVSSRMPLFVSMLPLLCPHAPLAADTRVQDDRLEIFKAEGKFPDQEHKQTRRCVPPMH